MSITFYYGSGSPYAWRVQLALEHKALAYDRKVLSFSAGDTRKPDFDADGLLTPALKSWKARIEALPYFAKTIPPHWQQS